MGLSVCETVLSILGKIWTLPNTLIGFVYGFTGHILGLLMGTQPRITFGNNAIQFTNNPLMISAMTLGNVIVYGSGYNPAQPSPSNTNSISLGVEEMQHTFQAEILGPFYFPAHLILGTAAVINNNNWHGSTNLLEVGPHSPTPRPWP